METQYIRHLLARAKPNEFCLFGVQFQLIRRHPGVDVGDTRQNVICCRLLVWRCKDGVGLHIIGVCIMYEWRLHDQLQSL